MVLTLIYVPYRGCVLIHAKCLDIIKLNKIYLDIEQQF